MTAVIACCGEALVDLVPHAVPGGGPMNAAIAASRLGAAAAFVGRVSTDTHGQQIWQHLTDNGVDLNAAQRGDEPTARAIVEHAPDLVFRFEGEGTADTCLADVDLSVLRAPSLVIHGGTLGLFRGRTADTIADLVEGHGRGGERRALVSLDPNVRPQIIDDRASWDHYHERWLAHADLYKASDEDLDWIWSGRQPSDVAAELLDRGLGAVVVTNGSDGAIVFTREGSHGEAGRSVRVADTVGAGDTFIGSVLVDLVERTPQGELARADLPLTDWTEILTRAVSAAALTCTRQGADPPTRDELAAFLAHD